MDENNSKNNMGCWFAIIIGIIVGIATGYIAIPVALVIGAVVVQLLSKK